MLIVSIGVIISLVYVTKAVDDIESIDDYQDNDDLSKAHEYLLWTSIACWITLGLLVIGVILLFVYGSEFAYAGGGWISNGILLFLIAMCITVGVIAAVAAGRIFSSGESGSGAGQTAYSDTIIAAVISLSLVGILFIGWIIYMLVRRSKAKKKAEAMDKLNQLKTEKYLDKITSGH